MKEKFGVTGFFMGLIFLFSLTANAWAGELKIKISVTEPSGVARKSVPVSGGIPLPLRVYKKDQVFTVTSSGGQAIAAQVLPLVVDKDGFVSWVLVDLQTDIPAKGRVELVLRAGGQKVSPPVKLQVTEGNDGVTVNTGKMVFTISKTLPFSLFSSVKVDGKNVISGGKVSYTSAWGEKVTYIAAKPESVTVEYAGDLRTTICVKGKFVGDDDTDMKYISRITAWAGKKTVQVKHILANSNSKHYCYRQIKDSSITLDLSSPANGNILGAGKLVEAGAEATLVSGLRSGSPGASQALNGDEKVWSSSGKSDVAQGWILAKTGATGIFACDAYFSDDPPRKLACLKNKLVLTGTTTRFESDNKRHYPFAAANRVLFDCSHLSSEYLIDFASGSNANSLSDLARSTRQRLHLMAEPGWYSQSNCLGVGCFGTQSDELRAYDIWKWKYNKAKSPTSAGRGVFKTRFVLWADNHFDTEQDCVEALLLMYLRTGLRSYLNSTEAWANYNMDRQLWRTDGWLWKDGGVWKRSGPLGNKPQRGKDPLTGTRNYSPGKKSTILEPGAAGDMYKMSVGSQCKCHNYASGMAAWYCITGDRDALEAAVDSVEQQFDTQKRAFRKAPGKSKSFSRDFTRSVYLTNAVRLAAPTNPFVVEASNFLTAVYLKRTVREPRGLVTGSIPLTTKGFYNYGGPEKFVGAKGMAALKAAGVEYSSKDGLLTETATGIKWYPIVKPNSFMLPSLAGGIEAYYRATGDEDAHDWVIAFGKGLACVLYQKAHNLQHKNLLTDFPKKGIVKDWASWNLPEDSVNANGLKMSGYLSRFYPDVCARAYALCGEEFLKQRSYDYWNHGSHRGYNQKASKGFGSVASWVNVYGVHSETVCFTGRTFYEWAHPRKDAKPPVAVKDLKVSLQGGKALISFTAPADQGGGKVLRYQVKCSDKPIISYEDYLQLFNQAKDEEKAKCNWWMASNLQGEPSPKTPGSNESFTVSGVPAGIKYFAVRAFDDSVNRSALSNMGQ
jgi:PcRGLX-like protein central beta sandwich domain